MQYTKVKIITDQQEIVSAFLHDFPFESFEETEEGLNAYLPSEKMSESIELGLNELKNRFHFTFSQEVIQPQNWNALWESNFDPILIDDFCGIRADFHPPIAPIEHEIVINPRMAFGTGHHETTYMVIQAMRNLNFKETKVLDYGCGTGILAILAAKLGSPEIVGVDIEAPAVENTIDNLQINHISGVKVLEGTLEEIKDGDYDIILANINRNVILATLPALYLKLKQGGTLLVSGFIKEDANLLQENAESAGFNCLDKWQRNNWICMAFSR